MNNLQNKMLTMLKEIDDICSKHGIKYCLFAGSALGAERHGGFIPWDDDADIAMTLENYEKFLKVFDAEAKEGRKLNCLENDTNYPFTYARYVDTTTTAIQRHTAFGGCDPGIKVDIFIFVPTHKDSVKAEKHRLEILAFSEAVCKYALMHQYRPIGYDEVYKLEKKLYDKWGRKKYIKKRMTQLKKQTKKNSGRYVMFSGMACDSYIIDADILDETYYVKYESTKLPISKKNVQFSKELYGESWISKPQNVETPRHVYMLDMNKSYHDYINTLWQNYDFKTAEATAVKRRELHLIERDVFKDVKINNQKLRNLAVEMDVKKAFQKLPLELRNDWRIVYQIFDKYYEAQLKANNKKYHLIIELDEEVFAAAINAAIMMDRYYEAADIMKIAENAGEKDRLESKLMYRVGVCRDITETLFVEKDLEKLQNVLDSIVDEMVKNSLTVKLAKLWLEVATGMNELGSICNTVDKYLQEYGEVGELLSVKGYCLEAAGHIEEATTVYEKAAYNVRNGYMYQWLADKGYSTYEYQYE